jgi:hypothetical protein
MNFTRWAAVTALAAMLSLQAQTPAPTSTPAQAAAPAPASGATLDETFAFIDKIFIEQGQLQFRQRFYASRLQDYTDWTETKIELQSLRVTAAPCAVETYGFSGSLGSVDPRTIHIVTYAETLDSLMSGQFDQQLKYSTDPEAYVLTFGASDKGIKKLGVFLDKSVAERVAKAYIHASVLCGAKADPF